MLQNEPSSHGVHSPLLASPAVLLYEPSKHGKGADEPSAQNEPAGHVKHAVAPLTLANVPPAHLSHTPCPAFGCTVPGAHGVGAVAASGHAVPASQAVQSACDAKPAAVP